MLPRTGEFQVSVNKGQLDVLPGVLGLVLDADHVARYAGLGELAGELGALDDPVVPVDAAGRDH
jgi:hypothetical protein